MTIYTMYIPIFVYWMKRERGESVLRRFIIPAFAILGSAFMAFTCILAHKTAVIWYLIVFAVVMAIGVLINRKNGTVIQIPEEK